MGLFFQKYNCINKFSNKNKSFSNNRLTSERERGIILVNKDKHAFLR